VEVEYRFLNSSFKDLIEYIEQLESEVVSKNNRIKELIIESTELEVRLERYE
jgi:hypothetical protein